MSDKISIDYNAVYATCAEKCAQLAAQKDELEREYKQLRQCLDTMDGGTNARINAALVLNERKAAVLCELLQKLLYFMETSAKQYEADEQVLARGFETSMTQGTKQGGTA